jgi:hypothetical protein
MVCAAGHKGNKTWHKPIGTRLQIQVTKFPLNSKSDGVVYFKGSPLLELAYRFYAILLPSETLAIAINDTEARNLSKIQPSRFLCKPYMLDHLYRKNTANQWVSEKNNKEIRK